MDANEEFRELLKQSGWNQAEASRRLELTTADVSRYMTGKHPPDKQTLRLFRILLMGGDTLTLSEVETPYRVPHHGRPAAHDDFFSEMRKLREQFAAVERAAERLRPLPDAKSPSIAQGLQSAENRVAGNASRLLKKASATGEPK